MLRFNPGTGAWVLYARTTALQKRAFDIGLDQSVPATAEHGFPVFFSHSEYAALPLWDVADPDARDRLFLRRLEYEASQATDGSPRHACPSDREFMPLQDAAIAYALGREHVVVGDEVGVGKTPTAIGVANEMQAKRVVVACPANLRLQWQREVRAWSTIPGVTTYPITKSADGVSPYANWTFVSYDLLRSKPIFKSLMTLKFDLLVADEIQYAKNSEAARAVRLFGDLSGAVPGLASRAERVLGLTGTLLPNRPREGYMSARHLCWDAIDWLSEDGYQDRYNPSYRGTSASGKSFVAEKRGRLPELRARFRCNFMVRRTKQDPEVRRQLAVTLPNYELTYIEPNGAIKRVLQAERLLDIDPDDLEGIDAEMLGHISTLRKDMGVAKAPRVVEHVQTLLGSGLDKVVVFAHHREVIELLATKLARGRRIWGGTTPAQKQRLVDQFVNDPATQVLVCQMQSGGVGTDGLQKVCRWAVLAEPSWVAGDNEQVAGRVAARRGQTRDVWVQYLVAPGSLDERVIGSALRKLKVNHQALDGDD